MTTKTLYAVQCQFKATEDAPTQFGIAICESPDDVVTFIHADGMPYTGKMVWNYRLHHHKPWAVFECDQMD